MYPIAPADKSKGGRARPVMREGEEGGGVETLRSDKAGGRRGGESVGRSGELRFTLSLEANGEQQPGGSTGIAGEGGGLFTLITASAHYAEHKISGRVGI